MRTALLLLFTLCLTAVAQDLDADSEGIYIIFDGSGSMWGQLNNGEYKIQAAREVLSDFVAQDFGARPLALRVYGHRRKGDCDDTELVQDFGDARTLKIKYKTL